jgi:uncharacterized membrane protein YphA (DoxX/SURF4 family)
MHAPIPVEVLYAGLAGVVISLIVATAQQKWSCKVFFLLALRLAIGWHFLFEGLYKVQSYYTGPTGTNRAFTSEPYFRLAPGPLGPYMRAQFSDPMAVIDTMVKRPENISPEEFDRLGQTEQAAKCPPAVAAQLDALKEPAAETVQVQKAIDKINEKEKQTLALIDQAEAEKVKAADSEHAKKEIKETYADRRKAAKADAEKERKAAQAKVKPYADADQLLTAAKASYARWVYGVERRPSTHIVLDEGATYTGPGRLAYIDWLRKRVEEAETLRKDDLGVGHGLEVKRAADWRQELVAAELALAKDAQSYVAELKKFMNGGKDVKEEKPATRGHTLDLVTMWFLVVVGTFLMAGFLTRLSCLMAAGFLVMTYLAFPPFPWFPVAPNTEGNPLFVNKNVIECLALLSLACMPTGKWLGLDALVSRIRLRRRREEPATNQQAAV